MRVISLARVVEIASTVGYPRDKRHLIERLHREGAKRIEGPVQRGQRGFLYEIATLPQPIRDALADGSQSAPLSPYQKATRPQKAEAEVRLAIVREVGELIARGAAWSAACGTVAAGCSLSAASVKNLWRLVKDRPEGEWLDLLVKRYKGSERHEYPEQIWAAFLRDYGRVEEPGAQAVYDRVKAQAEREGWSPMPSLSTLKRRWNAEPELVKVVLRKGEKAAADLLPSARRDRSDMRPMDGWNGDFRLCDINVTFTHTPNLDQLMALASAEEATMDDTTRAEILALLKLDPEADDAALLAAIRALVETPGEEAQSARPDPAKWVPIGDFQRAVAEANKLRQGVTLQAAQDRVGADVRSGKILPWMKDWAVELCTSNMPAYESFLAGVGPGFSHLLGRTLGVTPPELHAAGGGTDDDTVRAVAQRLGLSEDEITAALRG